MKFLLLALVLVCSYTAFAAAPAYPTTLEGYTGLSRANVKATPLALNTFISFVPSFIIKAVNERQVAPSSYSVIMRYAFRKAVEGGTEFRYYIKASDPKNPEGTVYFGYYDAFASGMAGVSSKFLGYAIEQRVSKADL